MKKLILGLSMLALLASCTAETKTEVNTPKVEETDSTENAQDTEVIEAAEVTQENMKFEDYKNFENRAKLIEFFGEENLENGTSWYGEGTMQYPHTLVTNPKTGHVVKILWNEADTNTINFIEAHYKIYDKDYQLKGNQNLQTKTGLSLGMSLKDLVTWNDGEKVEFSGFAWDFHGGVHAAKESKIAMSEFSLTMDYSGDGMMPEGFAGDVTLSSNDKKVMDAPIVLGTITMH